MDERILRPRDLGVIMGYRCQCACKHCLYNCGPTWRDWMSPETLREALRAASAWGPGFQVHLTGGEPFLNFDLLLDGVRIARELGIPRYVETNAGWCVDVDEVAERFTTLWEAGLQVVLISCSPFHAERIPLARTVMAIEQALAVFGPNGTIIYLPEWLSQIQSFGVETTTSLERYVERYGLARASRLLWDGYGIISGGRAGYALGQFAHKRPAQAFQGQTCRGEILYAPHSHFDLYGNYIPSFCGGLAVGDWHGLAQLRADFAAGRYPPLVGVLVQAGPSGLCQMAVSDYGYEELPGGYAGKCHLCVDVRKHLAEHDEFAELQPRAFYDSF